MDGGVRNISYVVYVLVTYLSKGTGGLTAPFFICMLP